MNKALVTTLVALAGTFGAAAHAQSSVTLYGTLDTGIDYISNQKTATQANSGAP
jgi:predicted porin